MDSYLEKSRSRSLENIENGLLIGQKEPLVVKLERERTECSTGYEGNKQWFRFPMEG